MNQVINFETEILKYHAQNCLEKHDFKDVSDCPLLTILDENGVGVSLGIGKKIAYFYSFCDHLRSFSCLN